MVVSKTIVETTRIATSDTRDRIAATGRARADCTIYSGTFSKSPAAGLRPRLHDRARTPCPKPSASRSPAQYRPSLAEQATLAASCMAQLGQRTCFAFARTKRDTGTAWSSAPAQLGDVLRSMATLRPAILWQLAAGDSRLRYGGNRARSARAAGLSFPRRGPLSSNGTAPDRRASSRDARGRPSNREGNAGVSDAMMTPSMDPA